MGLLSKLLPLVLLALGLLLAAFIGYAIYTIATDVASKTSAKMEKKNIAFGKEGMKIGVKEVKNENYVDQTQSLLVKAWNLSTWPAYKSRIGWNKEGAENGDAGSGRPGLGSRHGSSSVGGSSSRVPYSRSGSSNTAAKVK